MELCVKWLACNTHLSIKVKVGEVSFGRQLIIVIHSPHYTLPYIQQSINTTITGNLKNNKQ